MRDNGFNLTNVQGGVNFDLNNDGTAECLAWTAAGSDEAFLVLDRNGNGRVDNGAEVFGNYTPQPPSLSPNGFIALAEYDKAVNGGNSDGVIDNHDGIFNSLRLWQDTNHNGISETGELHTLSEYSVVSLALNYKESILLDRHGNRFRYVAPITIDSRNRLVKRLAWDVYLMTAQ